MATYRDAWRNLELELRPSPPREVEVDRDMIRQVLVNLCDNASLARGDGGGRVELRLDGDGRRVRLEVRDNGPGIPDAIRPRLFEPYTTTRGVGEGMGLGLAISKKILLDHHGDLELASTSADGATFRLVLPDPSTERGPTA